MSDGSGIGKTTIKMRKRHFREALERKVRALAMRGAHQTREKPKTCFEERVRGVTVDEPYRFEPFAVHAVNQPGDGDRQAKEDEPNPDT